ncbi:hypothetical protein A1O1_07034 [Capronia coronata CBS 617.96]|uniref:SPRY domain-containing protein n=1 Tax=Capronia coronata CBS 617.96 TaxID=1182541 RepID=W9Y2G7_9EURO|nr:uncharacterized protein A1O1_07034 [Capronia coronata CBS 617.96]EXJ83411.1 hypothetical protein A1O1_07034 [Capronia coronata CBS 617.96]
MGLFKSLKGKLDVGTDTTNPDRVSEYSKSGETQHQHQHQYQHQGQSQHLQTQGYNPIPHLPPSDEQYEPPPGPPPSHLPAAGATDSETFLPPPGPPPSAYQKEQVSEDPHPHSNSNPPPYHDWTVVPDTALLPPPPPLPEDYSPTNNASYDSAARAHEWCAAHPVYTPSRPAAHIHALSTRGEIALETPSRPLLGRGFTLQPLSVPNPTSTHIRASKLRQPQPPQSSSLSSSLPSSSTWLLRTTPTQQDAIITSNVPLYFAAADNPLLTGRQRTIYFEIVVQKIANDNSGVAIGFAAKPYPPWRLPGWHRASIGVHGDDGRRYVNDSWGGRAFVDAFQNGETIGVGMTFWTSPAAVGNAAAAGIVPAYSSVNSNSKNINPGTGNRYGKVKTTAFITRQGRTDPRWSWEIDEERDERDEGVDGLMGEGDLYAAVGVFGGVEVEIKFGAGLMWTPEG